eukprot:TRINITY_DN361_c0_g1_i2.p1 TRINITY_DN361_c0_g1~~TRINITY_DN361_c0_g1_i2.p1  ORF type:complete len:120 (+),score=27.84 TRINITY_DN361_c0_g1_i2:30-362(+)
MTKNTPEEKKRSSSSKKKPSLPFSKRDLSKIVRFLKEKRIRLRDFEYDPDMDVLSMETSRRSVRRYLMLVNEIEGFILWVLCGGVFVSVSRCCWSDICPYEYQVCCAWCL